MQYAYDQATSSTSLAAIRILHRANGSKTGTILRQEELHFAGFGRVAKVRKLLPGIGWVVQETDYDAQGRGGHLMAGGGPYSQWYIAPHEVRDVVGKPISIYNRRGRIKFRLR